MPKIAIITLDGFNEIDSFVASYMLQRTGEPGWDVRIASPTEQVRSMSGVIVNRQMSIEELPTADAVLFGSGAKTRIYASNAEFLASIKLDPARQLIGSQCSGALLLAKLGLLDDVPVCTDLSSKQWVIEAGCNVVERPFYANGNVATAGGCLSSQYLAAWTIARLAGIEQSRAAGALRRAGRREGRVRPSGAGARPSVLARDHRRLVIGGCEARPNVSNPA